MSDVDAVGDPDQQVRAEAEELVADPVDELEAALLEYMDAAADLEEVFRDPEFEVDSHRARGKLTSLTNHLKGSQQKMIKFVASGHSPLEEADLPDGWRNGVKTLRISKRKSE